MQAPDLAVTAVPAFRDNYLWLVHRAGKAMVVDPGDAAPIEAALAALGLRLTAIVLTHHHPDHVGGVAALAAARSEPLPVYGPGAEEIAGVTRKLSEGDQVELADIGLALDVIEVPGHTRGHIAYVSRHDDEPLLFCGDTLFGCGCGRLFEGTAAQMQRSLARLRALPEETLVYCAHEYTLANIRFALAVEPGNAALQARARSDEARRSRNEPTVPFSIGMERATNPFLRWDVPAVRDAAQTRQPGAADSPVATFAALRAWKDVF